MTIQMHGLESLKYAIQLSLFPFVQPFVMHKSAHVLVNMYTLWQQQQWQWISSNTYLTAQGVACSQNHSENGTATIMYVPYSVIDS